MFGLSGTAIAGIAGAVGAVGGAAISANAANKAARTQADAANAASGLSQAQYEQNRTDLTPWREAGGTALGQMSAGTANGAEFNRDFTLADFQKDPGYQFRMDQGQQALERGAAARGGALGGGSLKALDRYGQNYASGEYQNAYNRFNADKASRFNRLASLAGTGQTATRDVANMGTANANQIGEYGLQGANARASGYVGQANAIGGGLSILSNLRNYGSLGYSGPNYGGPIYGTTEGGSGVNNGYGSDAIFNGWGG